MLISVLVIAAITVHAQAGYQSFTTDTVKGAQTKYKTSSVKAVEYGVVTFQFTADGFGSDSATFTLEGSNDFWTTSNVVSVQPYKGTAATTYTLGQSPSMYISYRLKIEGEATDTVKYSNVLFVYKK